MDENKTAIQPAARTCALCPTDISERRYNAKYCHKCAEIVHRCGIEASRQRRLPDIAEQQRVYRERYRQRVRRLPMPEKLKPNEIKVLDIQKMSPEKLARMFSELRFVS